MLSVTAIVDIMNLIGKDGPHLIIQSHAIFLGKCVVAGNVRRTAEIAFGDPNSDEYISLKDYR
jgi:hypothetical protein